MKRSIFLLTISFLTGCVVSSPQEQYQQINNDIVTYKKTNFSITNIPENISTQIPKQKLNPINTKNFTLKVNEKTKIKDKDETINTEEIKYEPLGNGYFYMESNSFINGILDYRIFSLTYQGYIKFKDQQVNKIPLKVYPLTTWPTDKISIDLSDKNKKIQSYLLLSNYGNAPVKASCKFINSEPEKIITNISTGEIYNYECQREAEGDVTSKFKYVFLTNFGIAFLTNSSSSYSTHESEIVGITID